jgi:RimJ/RimL family protein N-acetyltransferase
VLTPDSPIDFPFQFELLTERRLPLLAEWLARPHVAEYWGEPSSTDELWADYLAPEREDSSTEAFIVLFGSQPVGFVQVYRVAGCSGGWWPDERDPGARGIDQFLADEGALNQGLGTAMIRAFLTRLFASSDVTTIQTDPDPDNARAIRAYEKAGFVKDEVVDTPDGKALLMRCTRGSLAATARP